MKTVNFNFDTLQYSIASQRAIPTTAKLRKIRIETMRHLILAYLLEEQRKDYFFYNTWLRFINRHNGVQTRRSFNFLVEAGLLDKFKNEKCSSKKIYYYCLSQDGKNLIKFYFTELGKELKAIEQGKRKKNWDSWDRIKPEHKAIKKDLINPLDLISRGYNKA